MVVRLLILASILFSQNCTGCLDDCYDGFYFDPLGGGATIGSQLSIAGSPVPTGNTWNGPVLNLDLAGQVSGSPTWYYSGAGAYDPHLNFVVNGLVAMVNLTPMPDNCTGSYYEMKMTKAGEASIRDQQFGSIVSSSIPYEKYKEELEYSSKQYAYRHFYLNPGDLSIGVNDNAYKSFYDSISSTGVGKFQALNMLLMDSGKVNDAAAFNSGIMPQNPIEEKHKIVNDVYIKSWVNGTYKFDANQTKTLFDIAKQDPLIDGEGVYAARVLLGRSFYATGSDGENSGTSNHLARQGKVYPNPNDGTMQFDYNLPAGQVGEFMIYNLSGIKVAEYRLSEGDKNTLRIAETNLSNGVYFFAEIIDGTVITTGKLVIIR